MISPLLIAEDDENDVFFLRHAFGQAAIENPLQVARAIEYLAGEGKFSDRAQHPRPCLVILDLKMPRKNGMDVLRWKLAQPSLDCVPVIVLSSSADRDDIEMAYQLGANAYVVKPASIKRRTGLAMGIKSFWLEFNAPPNSFEPVLAPAA
jgi:DNA-binding response OmpR family regulator